MTKTFSKVLAVILSICVLFAVPVTANAETDGIVLSGGAVVTAYGDWHDDYVESVIIKIEGNVTDFAAENILTVGKGSSVANLKTLAVSGASYEFTSVVSAEGVVTNGTFKVLVPLNSKIDHAETYNFCFPAGTFTDGENLSEEYTFSVSGNAIIETLEVEEVPVTPIQKLIIYLSGLNPEGFWKKALDFLIAALSWFVNI